MDEVSEAIELAWEVVYFTLVTDPTWAGKLNNLGFLLGQRYFETNDLADLDYPILVAQDALVSTPRAHPS
jgi:hypothetical protein